MRTPKQIRAERLDTIREMESHARHLVTALEAADYARAQFHANNAASCLRSLIQDMSQQIEGRLHE